MVSLMLARSICDSGCSSIARTFLSSAQPKIITDLHDEASARRAHEHFRSMFEKKETPDDVPESEVPTEGGTVLLSKALAAAGLATSNSEGMRLVRQGAVQIDGNRVDPGTREIDAPAGSTIVVKVGKRRFARIRFVG